MAESRVEQFLGTLSGVEEQFPNKKQKGARLPRATGYPMSYVPYFAQPPVDKTVGQAFVEGVTQEYPAESSASTVDSLGSGGGVV